MTIQVAIVGIDGSGKSTVMRALPRILAAERGLTVGGLGDTAQVTGSRGDHLDCAARGAGPRVKGFAPRGIPLLVRLAIFLRWCAKALVASRALYPLAKLLHLAVQEHAAARMGAFDLVVTDGNLLVSSLARGANYRGPAGGRAGQPGRLPSVAEYGAILRYLLRGAPARAIANRLPLLRTGRLLLRAAHGLGLRMGRLPDVVVLLDVSAGAALERLQRRGLTDRHENLADLAQAREGYLRTIEAARALGPTMRVVAIAVDELTADETLDAVLRAIVPAGLATRCVSSNRTLGVPGERLTGYSFARRALHPRYLAYVARHFFAGAWREPLFLFSRSGRLLLSDGYSARVMRAIYRPGAPRWLARVFHGYPLHRAVRDRLAILVDELSREIALRLSRGPGALTIVTAPSGFADDVLGALERLAPTHGPQLRRVRLVALDLDPLRVIAEPLQERARALGVAISFVAGDLTSSAARDELGAHGPFDLAVFVGLSAWVPKPVLLAHLRWLREQTRPDGALVTDVFTAAPYALSGHHAGYRASYYPPDLFRTLLTRAGFDGGGARVRSGSGRINHVLLARPGIPHIGGGGGGGAMCPRSSPPGYW